MEQVLQWSQPPMELSNPPPASHIVPTVQNIVSTVSLGCKLDLKAIALKARNAEFNPNRTVAGTNFAYEVVPVSLWLLTRGVRFSAVVMRIREPRTTSLIFSSGKLVCIGAKTETQSKLAARKYARVIQKIGFPVKFKDFKIQNIVASCDLKFAIRLEQVAVAHGAFARYDPEIFPGLVYRMKQPKVGLIIFVSGKVVLTGAKRKDDMYTAFENIFPVLIEHRRNK